MTNHTDSEGILNDHEKKKRKKKRAEFKYLRQSHTHQRHYKRINLCQDQSSMELFWKK